ncbi:MAG: family 16 glycoside hydrolase [bacterium]
MKRKFGFSIDTLEERALPASYTISLDSPARGIQGYSDCRVIAGRLLINPALDTDGDGQVTVTATNAAEAIRQSIIGKVMVNTRKFRLPDAIYHFGLRTSRTTKVNAKSDKTPFIVTENLISLEDLARFPKHSDWDFNDTFWKVNVTEQKSVKGWPGFQEGPQSPARPGQQPPEEAHWTLEDDILRTPQGDFSNPLLKGSLTQEGPRYDSKVDFESFRMTVEYRSLDILPIAPAPNGNRMAETNQHFSNSGVYIYDRYEVQIIDPSKFKLNTGDTGVPIAAELSDSIINDSAANSVSFYVPGGLYGVPVASPDGKYWNRAMPTGEWNLLEIDFKPAVLKDIDPKDPSKGQNSKIAEKPARITVRLNNMTVLNDIAISNASGPLKGTGSRARADDYLVSGPVKLQSHWGSQVEFRNIRIDSLPYG